MKSPVRAGRVAVAALVGLGLMLATGCATQPDQPAGPADAPTGPLPPESTEPSAVESAPPAVVAEPQVVAPEPAATTVDDDMLYNLLVAELAGRSGRLDVALDYYLQAARDSADPRVAERATRIAVYSRDAEAAREAAQRWAELDPQSSEPRQVMAGLYLRSGQLDAAFIQLKALIENDEGGVEQGFAQASALIGREQNAASSLIVMRRLVEAYPDAAVGWYVLAQVSLRADDRQGALQALQQANTLQPGYADALLLQARVMFSLGQTEPAFATLTEAIERQPADAALRLGYARLLVQARQFERASVQFEELYSRNPDNHDLLYSLGLLAIESQRYEDATRYLQRLLELGARTSEANYYLGRVAESQSRFDDAIRHYLKVNHDESRLDAQIRTAVLLGRLDRVEDARRHLSRLRSQYPEPQDQVRFTRAEAEVLRIARQYRDAYDVLTQGLGQNPDDTDLLYTRALIAERLDRLDLFESDLLRVLELEPDNGHAYNALGYYLADRTDRLSEAETYLEQAIRLLPDDPAVIDSVGWLRYRQGRHDMALALLRKALNKMHDPEIAAHLGEVLWVTGDETGANEVWDKALEASPDDQLLNDVIRRFRR